MCGRHNIFKKTKAFSNKIKQYKTVATVWISTNKLNHENISTTEKEGKKYAYSNRVFTNKINPREFVQSKISSPLAKSQLLLKRLQTFFLFFFFSESLICFLFFLVVCNSGANVFIAFREMVNSSNTIYFRQHKWITKLLFTTQQSKVYYSSRCEGVRVRKCPFCVAGLYVGPWFVGSVFKASSERRVPSGISGGHVREMCFFC